MKILQSDGQKIIKYFSYLFLTSFSTDERVEGLPLHWAAAYGNIMGVMFFIEVMKQSVDARGPSKSTPLYYAGVNSMWDVYMCKFFVLFFFFLPTQHRCSEVNFFSPDLHKKGADQYIATVDGDLPADAFLSKVEKGNEKVISFFLNPVFLRLVTFLSFLTPLSECKIKCAQSNSPLGVLLLSQNYLGTYQKQ